MRAVLVVLAVLLASCAGQPQVVREVVREACEVPKVVTAPVEVPAALGPGATNGDLWERGGPGGSLETALKACNERLQDVQRQLGSPTTQPARADRPTSLRERLFGKPKGPTP